jgi:hypothetical protein
MPTTVIRNSCIAGAMGGLMAGRFLGSINPTDYAAVANAAAAIGTEFIAENAVLAIPMQDTDNAQIGVLVADMAYSCIAKGGYTSIVAADYLAIAKQIVAASKQASLLLVAGGLTPYLGAISTRASVPNNSFANTGPFTARSGHTMTDTGSPRPAWAAAFLAGNTGETTNGTLTIGPAAIEFPQGVFTPLLWGGNPTIVAAPGAMPIPDTPAIVLANGTDYWVAVQLQGSAVVMFGDGTQKQPARGDKLQTGGTDIHNIVDNNSAQIFPSVIVGTTTKRTIMGCGDSRIVGLSVNANANGYSGDFQHAFHPAYGGTRYGCTGITAATFNGNHALASQLAVYHSDVWLQAGINDVIAGTSAPSIQTTQFANIAIFTGLGKEVWVSTWQPANTSSNQWIDQGGQTIGTHDATRVTNNTSTRSGVYNTAAGFFEFDLLVELALNDGFWKFNGTPFQYTIDGAHLTNFSQELAVGQFVLPP